jgi:hypothetical protein
MNNKAFIVIVTIVGIAFLFWYSVWEQRRQLANLSKRVHAKLKGLGWTMDRLGGEIKSVEFGSALPLEMMTSNIQKPFFCHNKDKVWIFANRKTMHRRLDIFGNSVVVVFRLPYSMQQGVRLQENIRYANTKRPLDPRFRYVEQLQKGGRNWWVCTTDKSLESVCLQDNLLKCEIPHEIQAIQVLGGYLVSSSRSSILKDNSYENALDSTYKILLQFETCIDEASKDG